MSDSNEIKQAVTKHIDNIHVPEEIDRRVRQSFTNFHNKKERKSMKKRWIAFSLAAAILIPAGAFALNGSYFANPNANINGLIDKGVERALSEGLSIPMDEKITDKGLTIHIKEMYVEDARILVHYRAEQADGTLVPYEFDTTGLKVLSDGKKDGKQVENPKYQDPRYEGFSVLNFFGPGNKNEQAFYLTDAAGKEIKTGLAEKDKPEGVIAFVTDGTPLPQTIYMNVNINRIGETKGNWNGKIAIDQSKAKQATQTAR